MSNDKSTTPETDEVESVLSRCTAGRWNGAEEALLKHARKLEEERDASVRELLQAHFYHVNGSDVSAFHDLTRYLQKIGKVSCDGVTHL